MSSTQINWDKVLVSLRSTDCSLAEFCLRHPLKALDFALAKYLGSQREVKADLARGDQLSVVLPDVVSRLLYRYGKYETDMTSFLISELTQGHCFVDIGAHIGYFSLLASRLVGSSGKILAFEPTPRTRHVLRQNLQNQNNCDIMSCAAWAETSELTFKDYGWRYSAYNGFSDQRLGEVAAKDYLVRAHCADDIIEHGNLSPDFIKIDVEAAELFVLKGLKRTLQRHSPIVTAEVGDYTPGAPKSSETVIFMESFGYEPFEFVDGRLQKHNRKDRYKFDNLIFKKQS